jgi:hypothetical protein
VIDGTLHNLRGKLASVDGSQTLPLSLVQTGTWRWQASLGHVPSGWHQLVLESRLPARGDHLDPLTAQERSSIFAKRWVRLGTPSMSTEMTGLPAHESLLREIAQSTQGAYEAPDRALLPPTTTAMTAEPWLTWWIPLAILLLLVEVALRGSSML